MKQNILVVDDSIVARMHMEGIISEAGYRVSLVESGMQALAALKNQIPDLILLDIFLGDINGLEVCKMIKANEKTQDIPVILISGTADATEWAQGLKLGAVDCVLKPFNPMELLVRIHAHLALSHKNKLLKQAEIDLRISNEKLESEIRERKQIEEQNRITERLSLACRAGGIGIWEFDILSNKLIWDEQMFNLYGVTADKFKGTYETLTAGVYPEDFQRYELELWMAIREEKDFDTEYRVIWPDSTIHYIHALAKLQKDDSNQAITLLGTSYDITERKRTEWLLKNQKAYLEELVETRTIELSQMLSIAKQSEQNLRIAAVAFESQEGMMVTDSNNIILRVNRAFTEITGYLPEEVVGQNPRILQSGYHDNYFYEKMWESIRNTGCWQGEIWDRRKNGEIFPKWSTISAVTNEKGVITHYVDTHLDITERKQAEEALQKSESKLAAFISNAPTAIAMFDQGLHYLAYSQRWLEDYGLIGRNLINQHHYDVFPSIRDNEFWKDVHRRCLSGETIKSEEDTFIGVDGKQNWLRWDVRPWHLSDGDIGGIIMLTESITARKLAEVELEERNRFVESLIDLSPGIIYIYDIIDQKNVYSNEGVQKVLGYSVEEIQIIGGQLLPNLMHPDDFRSYLQNIIPKYTNLQDDEQIIHQYRMKHKIGSWRWLESTEAIYKRLPDGSPKQIFGTVQDITDKKMGEDALKSLATNFAKLSGKDFFREVSKHIATVANIDCVFIGELDTKKEKVIILGGYYLGEWLEMIYDISDTPCEKVMEKTFCFHPKSVQTLFPKDIDLVKMQAQSYMGSPILNKQNDPIGLMVAIHSKEMTNSTMITTLFNTFIDRVAAEILRANAEEALKLEKEKAETYLNLVEVILIAFDDKAKITLLNRKGHQVLGYEEGELLGKDWFKICLPPDEYESVFSVYKKIMAGDIEPFEYYENGILTRSGEKRWIAWHNSVIKNSDGQIVGTLSSGEDITDRKKAANELIITKEKVEESERTLRAIYESSQDAITITQNGRIVMVNQAFLDLLGFEDKNELIGKSFLDNISPSEHEKIKERHQKRSMGLEVSNFYETLGIRKNGEEFPFDVKVGNFEVNNQKFTIAIVRDITERKKSELELERHRNKLEELVQERTLDLLDTIQRLKETQSQLVQSEKLASLGILTAGIAHEINNPVNYINSSIVSLEILAKELIEVIQTYETITPENIYAKLKEIEELKKSINLSETIEGVTVLSDNIKIGAKKTADIIKSLRLFSRTDSDKPTLSNINESIDSTLILLHNQYADRIEIIKEYNELPPITCFPGKLNQVFMNLLANAIQAIEGNGTIHIKTMHMPSGSPDFKKESIYISISDSGSGIPLEIHNKIFEPFFTTKEIGKGTGLGLAISYGIIEKHRGKMEFTSEVSKGTEFKIYLPVVS